MTPIQKSALKRYNKLCKSHSVIKSLHNIWLMIHSDNLSEFQQITLQHFATSKLEDIRNTVYMEHGYITLDLRTKQYRLKRTKIS